jgi:hypothetical protein
MEQEQAVRILNALANGIHPGTGEVFSSDSPYQHPDTVRALFEALHVMSGIEHKPATTQEHRSASTASNMFARWTADEEQRLTSQFEAGKTSAELAVLLNRSRAAIEARLLKLGKIDLSELTVQLRYPSKAANDSSNATTP